MPLPGLPAWPGLTSADFGLAKKLAGSGMQTICGTPQYVAPEVIVGLKGHEYGPGVDMWSSGVVLFILLGAWGARVIALLGGARVIALLGGSVGHRAWVGGG